MMTTLGNRWSWPAIVGLIALMAGVVSGWKLLQHVGLALWALLVLSLLVTLYNTASLSAHSAVTARALTVGDRLIIRYAIRNRGIWPLPWTLLEPQGFATLPVQGQFVAVGPRSVRELDVSLPCPQRGRWPAGGWELRIGDPFGFFERTRTGGSTGSVLVYPRPVPLPGLVLPLPSGRAIGPRGRPTPQPSATIREVRSYRPGDPLSRVHWLSTARLDTLMVKESEGEPAAHAWVILDLDDAVHHGEYEESSAELIIGAACDVLHRLQEAKVATGLLLVGSDTLIPPEGRYGQSDRLLEALALAHTGPGNVAESLSRLRARVHWRKGLVLVLTPWADARWTGELPALVRSGYTVLCLLLNTPNSSHETALAAQTAVLHTAGVPVYRHTVEVG